VKEAAISALGHSRDGSQALAFIVAELASADPAVREAAFEALLEVYETNPDAVVSGLSRSLVRNEDRQTAELGSAVLARLADPGSLSTLTVLLSSPFPEVRKNAAWGIYRIRSGANARIVEELNKLVNDETEPLPVRINAVRALGAVGPVNPRVDSAEALLKMVRLRDEGYYMLRFFALEALGDLGDSSPAVLGTLTTVALRERDPQMKRKAVQTVRRLIANEEGVEAALIRIYRASEDDEIRTLVVEALGDIGSSATAGLGGELIASGGVERKRVIYALAQAGRRGEIETILDAAADPELAPYVELVLQGVPEATLAGVIDDRLRTESNAEIVTVMENLQATLAESF
jgi:HEAT repeat protein